jgi:hypothetical protein
LSVRVSLAGAPGGAKKRRISGQGAVSNSRLSDASTGKAIEVMPKA